MLSFMARPLRIEYSGAVYHVMALAELKGLKGRKKTSHTSEVSRSHGMAQAEEMIQKSLDCLGFILR